MLLVIPVILPMPAIELWNAVARRLRQQRGRLLRVAGSMLAANSPVQRHRCFARLRLNRGSIAKKESATITPSG
jgi:hypothetical protein